MIKKHLSTSLAELLHRVATWVERLPPWLRPAFFGAGLVLAFMLWRGGLVLLPIVFVYLLIKNPAVLMKVLPLLIYVPGAGFLGGLLYGITAPALRPLGKAGSMLQFILGTWVYCVLLVFFIMPVIYSIQGKPSDNLSNSARWIISGGMAVIFGLALGIGATSHTSPGPDN